MVNKKSDINKILIIRLSSIGDIVLTSPIIRSIKKKFPKAEIHFLTKKQFEGIVESSPYVSCTHIWNKKLWKQVFLLRNEGFDHIIDLHKNYRTLLLKTFLGVPNSTFNKLQLGKYLLTNFKINRLPKTHIVNRYAKAMKPLGVQLDGKGLDYFIKDSTASLESIFPTPLPKKYLSFVIGAAHGTKKLPASKIAELVEKINEPIVFIGGKEELEIAEKICKTEPTRLFNACGIASLDQSALLVKNSAKVITHDTGFMHIAAAFNKEIITIWGNTTSDFGMYPYKVAKSFNFEKGNLSCRPCSKIGFEKCPKGHFKCMNDQPLNEIAAIANK
ncbi:MAG: ADP-heptose:LPS heptosyltransferase [Sphingobacteriales bacterium]|jgi:ADP-heptose:LPS heptosyltransferase